MLVQSYLTRARDFFKGVMLVHEDAEYKHSAALLAIHSAISYADALRSGLGSRNLAADDHRSASAEVRRLLSTRGYTRSHGVRHLERLVAIKTSVAYSRDRLTQQETKSIVEQAQRFAIWVEQAGSDLKIERWGDDITD